MNDKGLSWEIIFKQGLGGSRVRVEGAATARALA